MTRDELIVVLEKEAGHDEVEGGFAHSLMRAAIAELRKRDWQLIASAPKDGTWLMVINAEAKEPKPWFVRMKRGQWVNPRNQPIGTALFTHWQPLPAPPEVTP